MLVISMTMLETGTSYRGGSEEKVDARSASIHDSKASLAGLPDPGFAIYILLNMAVWLLIWLAVQGRYGVHEWSPHYLAFAASAGPVVIAQVMANLLNNIIFHTC